MLNGLKKMAVISDKKKEKLLSNKWLQEFASRVDVKCTCSNCVLYNRATKHCKFDDSIIDNPNVLDVYCEWWAPMKWILDKYKKKYPYFRMWGIGWIKNTTELRQRKEYLKKIEEGEKIVELSDKPAIIDSQNMTSNMFSEQNQYCYNQSKNNARDDKKEYQIPESLKSFITYLSLLFN